MWQALKKQQIDNVQLLYESDSCVGVACNESVAVACEESISSVGSGAEPEFA